MSVIHANLESKTIKELVSLVDNKRDFVIEVANAFDKEPKSLYTNWFNNFYSVPKALQTEVKAFTINYLKQQRNESA